MVSLGTGCDGRARQIGETMHDNMTRKYADAKAYARARRAVLDAFAWAVIRGELEMWREDNASTYGFLDHPDIELTAAEILDRAEILAADYRLTIGGDDV